MLKIEYNKKYSDNTVWKKYKIISCTEFDGFMQFFFTSHYEIFKMYRRLIMFEV